MELDTLYDICKKSTNENIKYNCNFIYKNIEKTNIFIFIDIYL